jgi:glycosyltransferase involved in cell wall biosynthesis
VKDKKYKILFLVHIPPPMHGVSAICNQVYSYDFKDLQVCKKLVRLNLSRSIIELRYFSLVKIFRLCAIGFNLFYQLLFFRPDLVYFSIMPVGLGFMKDFLFTVLLKLFRLNIVYHIHNKGIPGYVNKFGYKFLYKHTFKNCTIIHLSEHLIKREFAGFNLNKTNQFIVPNGIAPLKEYKIHKEKSELIVLFFSNLIPEKGYLTCLKSAHNLIKNKNKNIKLIIAGNPTRKANNTIKNFMLAHPETEKHIEIKGAAYYDDKAKLFHEADLFIFPSRFTQECMPLVILEAMSIGLPVIASNIGAIPEMVTDNRNGFLIPPGNDDKLSEKIEYLLENRELIKQFGEESFIMYNEKFTQNHFLDNIEKVFKNVLQIRK